MFIRSEPPGATVMIDGRVVGTTPLEKEFLSYGQLRVDLELEGHQDLRGSLVLDRPWWQTFPFAFVSDVLWPGTLTDEISFDFVLVPVEEYTSTWEEAREAYERMKRARPAAEHPTPEADDAPPAPEADDAPPTPEDPDSP